MQIININIPNGWTSNSTVEMVKSASFLDTLEGSSCYTLRSKKSKKNLPNLENALLWLLSSGQIMSFKVITEVIIFFTLPLYWNLEKLNCNVSTRSTANRKSINYKMKFCFEFTLKRFFFVYIKIVNIQ